jgi:hypothetical protein
MTTPMTDRAAIDESALLGEVDFKDFTVQKKYIGFSIDGDKFIASARLGISTIQSLVNAAGEMEKVKSEKDVKAFDSLFAVMDEILLPDSARRFREKAMRHGPDTIDVRRELLPALYYLLEEYGVRPTQPSSLSSSGSPDETSGTTSTGGAPPEASIQLT